MFNHENHTILCCGTLVSSYDTEWCGSQIWVTQISYNLITYIEIERGMQTSHLPDDLARIFLLRVT